MAAPVVANAVVVDLTAFNAPLTAGPSGSYFGSDYRGAGTGNFDPFLSLNSNDDIEAGYSTDSGPINSNTQDLDNPNTRAITYGDLRYITSSVSGVATDYAHFLLDINEPSGGDKEFLVLSALKIFAPQTVTGQDPLFSGNISQLGTPLFDLGDSRVLMDYSHGPGSGGSDIAVLIPLSLFSSITSTNQRIVFYSEFGSLPNPLGGNFPDGYVNDSAFEEWKFDGNLPFVPPPPPPPPVPEPATFAFAGVLVAGLAFAEVRRRRKS